VVNRGQFSSEYQPRKNIERIRAAERKRNPKARRFYERQERRKASRLARKTREEAYSWAYDEYRYWFPMSAVSKAVTLQPKFVGVSRKSVVKYLRSIRSRQDVKASRAYYRTLAKGAATNWKGHQRARIAGFLWRVGHAGTHEQYGYPNVA